MITFWNDAKILNELDIFFSSEYKKKIGSLKENRPLLSGTTKIRLKRLFNDRSVFNEQKDTSLFSFFNPEDTLKASTKRIVHLFIPIIKPLYNLAKSLPIAIIPIIVDLFLFALNIALNLIIFFVFEDTHFVKVPFLITSKFVSESISNTIWSVFQLICLPVILVLNLTDVLGGMAIGLKNLIFPASPTHSPCPKDNTSLVQDNTSDVQTDDLFGYGR